MNENMQRLMELVNEVSDLTEKVNKDTVVLREQFNNEMQAKLDHIWEKLTEYVNIAQRLRYDIYVRMGGASYYFDGRKRDNLALRISCYKNEVSVGVYDWEDGKCDCSLGWLSHKYSSGKMGNNIGYRMDEIINSWDEEEFEKEFTEQVQEVIRLKAEKANREYEEAKAKLQK